jgi:hypothetical protein
MVNVTLQGAVQVARLTWPELLPVHEVPSPPLAVVLDCAQERVTVPE